VTCSAPQFRSSTTPIDQGQHYPYWFCRPTHLGAVARPATALPQPPGSRPPSARSGGAALRRRIAARPPAGVSGSLARFGRAWGLSVLVAPHLAYWHSTIDSTNNGGDWLAFHQLLSNHLVALE
jgi:hypothetical protein